MEHNNSRVKTLIDELHAQSDLHCVPLTLPPLPPSVLNVSFCDEEIHEHTDIQNGCVFPLCIGEVFQAPVNGASYLTSGDDVKKVISFHLDTMNSDVLFSPGDTIAILPCNSDQEVEEFVKYFNMKDMLHKKCLFSLQNSSKKKPLLPHIPSVSSLHHVLKSCVDIRFVPKKAFLRVLSEHTSDAHEKRMLQEFCSKEGSSIYNSCILECGTNIQDILSAFPSCQPPIGRVLEQLPRLQPRPYSIASSPLKSPKSVRIVLSVVDHPVRGVCSGWLEDLLKPLLETSEEMVEKQMKELSLERNEPCLKVPVFFRKTSYFNLPDDPLRPLIFIGPGTGIAPFIGFLEHRAAEKRCSPHISFGEIWLFYGCRYEDRDYLFRSNIEQFLKEEILSQFFVSFSRGIKKENGIRYVQDNIKKHAKSFVHQILEKKSMIFVCGDGKKMAKDVWDTIVHLISSEKGISETEGQSILLAMQKEGSYKQDIWL